MDQIAIIGVKYLHGYLAELLAESMYGFVKYTNAVTGQYGVQDSIWNHT
jgi:hypothetical protein